MPSRRRAGELVYDLSIPLNLFSGKILNGGITSYDDTMKTARIDDKGRLLIPKEVRKGVGIGEGSFVRIGVRGKSIIVEPMEPIADKYFGAFKVSKWPRDLDEFLIEATKNWWSRRAT